MIEDEELELPEDSQFLVTYGKVISSKGVRPSVYSKKVVAVTSLRVCRQFCSKDGCSDRFCPELHLCPRFVYGNCWFNTRRKGCRYPHDFHSEHNVRLLNASDLFNLEDSHLRVLLLQNDPSLLPKPCHLYNKNNGRDDACKFEKCQRLHICQHFLNGNCRYGDKCKRSHDFRNVYHLLEEQGFEHSLIPNLLSMYHNIYDIINSKHAKPKDSTPCVHQSTANRKRRADSEEAGLYNVGNKKPKHFVHQASENLKRNADNGEICVNYIAKNCRYKAKCFKHHFDLPYRWQIFKEKWEDLPNMEHIERTYCNPNNVGSAGWHYVDFQKMICYSNQVRRLSTPSSVTKRSHIIFTTVWIWYWKDEYSNWIEYGNQDEIHCASTVTSRDLEKAYQENNDGVISFQAGRYDYKLRFKDMIQENKSFLTQREVQRRPKYVSAQDLENIRKRRSTQMKNVPSNWDKSALPEVGYELVQLSASSKEYNEISTLFRKTMNFSTIQKIERIQNVSLWEAFQLKKKQMKKNNNGRDVDERLLFHGTDDSKVEGICCQNFDWRVCGTNGTAYGKGSYFARDASYSNDYSTSTSSSRFMFVARVLVGQFLEGYFWFVVPLSNPEKANRLYDSCVDSMHNPSIFVIFEKHQIYPEYLIKYYNKTSPSTNNFCLIL
ncbi:protein mono-ADP-ribosyltransferase PARP12-like [Protopterus annectens]|uniref:protein mono-ADP-ribosyltransferase PARP12-like n=1 Tax=Protopterus annectens TaxID=7888 RepID=UPI001CFC1B0C|nr:protein mono-ADP-ribosyltransferase PARP12-like [Protopterus annectens]